MEKRSRDAKEKTESKHEGSRFIRKHHKHDPRSRSTTRPSRRPYDNFYENYTPLNTKRADVIKEVNHLKLIPEL